MEIILGPPGTGKTTALLNILEEELSRGAAPEEIGFVSFTKKAAHEAVTRAVDRFNLDKDRFIWFRTLHSLCYRMTGMQRSQVFEGRRIQEFAKWAGIRITGRWNEDGSLTGFELGDRVIHMTNLSRVKDEPLRRVYNANDDNLPWNEVERVASALEAWKKTEGLFDYTDMLSEFLAKGISPGIKVLLVDEAQDLSLLQWSVVRRLAEGCRRVVIAGDDDQAIFEWGGADVDYFVSLEGDETILGQSYRVPMHVQRRANEIIQRVRTRRHKEWTSRAEPGVMAAIKSIEDLALDDLDDGGANPPIMILARNTYILRDQIEPELRHRGIYYERAGKPSVPREMLMAITTWERMRNGDQVPVYEMREVIKHMTSGRGYARGQRDLPGYPDDGHVTMKDLRDKGILLTSSIWHEAMDRLPKDDVGYIIKMRQHDERLNARPRVRVSTIHAAKGGEADHVVLMREMAPRAYREMEKDPDAERRVWYVAATRARSRLTVVESTTAQACPWV